VPEVSAREVWWALVVGGVRSKVGAALLAVGIGVTVWSFATGHLTSGLVVLGFLVFTYARIPAAIGAAIGARNRRRT
jgi:hypothetical protein